MWCTIISLLLGTVGVGMIGFGIFASPEKLRASRLVEFIEALYRCEV